MELPHQKYYDKKEKIAIASLNGADIFITEFLFAKNRGFIEDLRGHSEIDINYFRLLPFIFMNIQEVYENIPDSRFIYVIFDNQNRRIFHVVDELNCIVSIFAVSEKNFQKQLNRRFRFISNLSGRANLSSILSPASPFWRQIDLIEQLYTHFVKNTITQEHFIKLVDEILEAKQKIKEYKILLDEAKKSDHFDREIKLKKELESLENLCNTNEKTIDERVYKLYDLSEEEIGIVEGKK